MHFDHKSHLASATRKVAFQDRDNKPASDVTLSRTFETTVDDIWDALANPERLSRWFTNVTGDLQLNGRYHVEANASGTITECEPQSHFALTWEFAGDISWGRSRPRHRIPRPITPNPHTHFRSFPALEHLRTRSHRRRMGDGFPRASRLHIRPRLRKAR